MKKIESRKQTRYYYNAEKTNVVFYSDQVELCDVFELIGGWSNVRIQRFFGVLSEPMDPGDPLYDPQYPDERKDFFDFDPEIKKFKKFFRMSELIKFMESQQWAYVSFTIERKDGVLFHRLVRNELVITMPKSISHFNMTLGFLTKLKQQNVFPTLLKHKGSLVTVNRLGKAYYRKLKLFKDYYQPNFFRRFPGLK